MDVSAFTTALIYHFTPRYIFTIGILGGRKRQVKFGDVILASNLYFYGKGRTDEDGELVEVEDFGPEKTNDTKVKDFSTVTAPQWGKRSIRLRVDKPILCTFAVRNDEEILKTLHKKWHVTLAGVEMESWGIWKAVRMVNRMRSSTPAVEMLPVCKGVSDILGTPNNDAVRKENRSKAAFNAAVVGIAFLCYRFPPDK